MRYERMLTRDAAIQFVNKHRCPLSFIKRNKQLYFTLTFLSGTKSQNTAQEVPELATDTERPKMHCSSWVRQTD